MECKKNASDEEKADCEKKQREAEEKRQQVMACVEGNKFSSMIRDETGSSVLGIVAEFLEYGAPTSLALDVHAYSMKTTRDFWRNSGGKEWASGFNWAAKKVSKVVGNSRLLGYAKAIGDKVTVPTAVVGAFTLGYNASIVAQCSTGVLK